MDRRQLHQLGNMALNLVDISKEYPGVKALDNVSLGMEKGKVHALIGENGAGKSTLIKIISGVIGYDKGTMIVNNNPVTFTNPRQAFGCGINVVHQERNVVPTFSVGENILLEKIAGKSFGMVNKDKIYQEAQEFIDMVGLKVPPQQKVADLSAAEIQLIEIARALSSKANILLLDEPTSSLSFHEANSLLKTIKRLRGQGVSFLYVSHKLEEVFEIADTVTVLRDGKNVGSALPIDELDRNRLVSLMVGRTENGKALPVRTIDHKVKVLEVQNVKSRFSHHRNSFVLHKGEILGWYGLVGAGRTELARMLMGYDPALDGEICINGEKAKIKSVSQAMTRWKIGYLSESRKEEGLFLTSSIILNVSASVWKILGNYFGFLKNGDEKELAEKFTRRLEIKTPSINQIVNALSGGNQQKVSFAKTLATKPDILIVDEPTVGVDVKTKQQIHELIVELSQKGVSIIVISSDLTEVVHLTDRILAFREGKICADLNNTKDYGVMSRQVMEICLKKGGIVDPRLETDS